MAARHGVRVWLALVTVYLVWGSTFIALAIAIRDLPPFLAMSVRHLIAGTVLLVVRASARRPQRRSHRAAADRRGLHLRRPAVRDRPRRAGLGAADGAGGCRRLARRDDSDLDGAVRSNRLRSPAACDGVRRHRGRLRRSRVPVRPVRQRVGRSSRRARDRRERDVLGRRLSLLARRPASEAPARLRGARVAVRRDPPRRLLDSSQERSARRRGRRTRSSRSPTSSSSGASSASPPTCGCFALRRSRSSPRMHTSTRSSRSRSAP